MKKTIVLFSSLALIGFTSMAQNRDKKTTDVKPVEKSQPVAMPAPAVPAKPATPAQPSTPALNPDLSIKFTQEDHNFGNIPEGPSASYEFEFKNIGKVPIIFSDVHGSCGCTVPVWPKEPILPGKTSKIAVTYSTQGRPGPINKTVTCTSNVGTKVIKISGNVEKAATPATPAATPNQPAQQAH